MKNKRGQFYIIAAIIIVVVISGIATVANYAKTPKSPKGIESMSSDLSKEGPRIIDYGIYSREDLKKILKNFTADEFAPYFLKKTDNSNIVFIYGNKTSLNGVRYNMTSKGTISATIGGSTNWNIQGLYAENIEITPNPGDKTIDVNLLGKTFSFELQESEMFYFIIAQKIQNETYINRN